ncbi:hypothetical protein A6770_14400 [Nostoc minutum NIES-26]|uniref:Uncharacterized protein n=1 Tax=Nostoc minutum NIES-26 TaxID=1844469 RepID=A0A367RN74_9NOSO|nr:hypothetical protein A6770_14400 [Nostoc minutum NIES-26]
MGKFLIFQTVLSENITLMATAVFQVFPFLAPVPKLSNRIAWFLHIHEQFRKNGCQNPYYLGG